MLENRPLLDLWLNLFLFYLNVYSILAISLTSVKTSVIAQPVARKQFHSDEHIVSTGHSQLIGSVKNVPQQISVTEYDEH